MIAGVTVGLVAAQVFPWWVGVIIGIVTALDVAPRGVG